MRACISYNQPEPWQVRQSVVLTLPYGQPGDTVNVDACLAPTMIALWAAGIETYGSCCGHEDDSTPEVIVGQNATPEQIAEARRVLATVDARPWTILSWTLARYTGADVQGATSLERGDVERANTEKDSANPSNVGYAPHEGLEALVREWRDAAGVARSHSSLGKAHAWEACADALDRILKGER